MQVSPKILDRINQLRSDIDAMIDSHAEAIAKQAPGVPVNVLRMMLTNRAPGCQCRQALSIAEGK